MPKMININKTFFTHKKILKNTKYKIFTFYALTLVIFGLIMDSPENIFQGVLQIIIQPDTLITDYIGVGGIGAAFVNAGLLTLSFILLLYYLKIELNGTAVAALFVSAGFAFFGKNIFNVWLIILGVYIYSKVQKEDFSKFIYIALFGTTLAPIVTELLFTLEAPIYMKIPLTLFVGLAAGFILPPLSTHLIRVHAGFDLYNVGFTAGMIGVVFVSVIRSYGILPAPRMIWTSGNNLLLAVFLFSLFISMIVLGFLLNEKSFKGLKEILEYPGRLVTDFILLEGFPATLMNMGICGIIATSYILLINGDINGPTISGIFTVAGFAAFGKHPKNILPIFIGVFLGSLTKIWHVNDPSIQLAALFGTSLAPIAGEYGWKYGILAAFLHSSVVLNVGTIHGGLNLYNNGFSAGIVAALLVPIIEAFRKEDNL
ncbi:DUF1576 domain-containing protein [Irregularibacter muris]|uniref:DUF1576 domain-containing protein n=1 Tax=Irregularibacter muris TaxID=1796619 RepID=A0AAE3HFR3_9FIRM|nr:DUF1576 domain-containing protein [Irregularibacter muris]MCR1899766.1 DUF1576 domain-containing protein [Irregularibacter muris]